MPRGLGAGSYGRRGKKDKPKAKKGNGKRKMKRRY